MLTGVDVRVLVHEIETSISRSWITNIYQLPSNIFIFKLRDPKEGTYFLLIEPGKRFHTTQFNREMPPEPPNFCRQLRSHLRDRRINSIIQRDLDRIIEMNIGPDPGYRLVVELFGEGNLILVSPNNKILTALRYRKMRDRDIHPGREFVQMPPAPRDIIRTGLDGFEDEIKKEQKIVVALNKILGLGPSYSRYVLQEVGITKKKVDELTEKEIEAIKTTCLDLRERLLQHRYQPVVYLEPEEEGMEPEVAEEEDQDEDDDIEIVEAEGFDEQWEDDALPFDPERVIKILPWPQGLIEGAILFYPESLNQAHDVFYSSQEDQSYLIEDAVVLETEADRYKRRLEQQRLHQQTMFEQAELERKKADTIYGYFNEVNELMTTVYNARKKKIPWETIIEKLEYAKGKGMKSAKILKEINPKKGTIVVELEGENGHMDIELDFTKQITDIANSMYENAKKMERKAKGADKAIEMTLEKIKEAESSAAEMRREAAKETTVLKRRKRWYEKWHWTIAPDGTIIIGGLDARTNEQLVKRYLEQDDFFLHADLVGAPFVIIKANGREPSQQTALAAATIGVAYSSAWKSKRVVADAYIVNPDQISLQAPSGEFLPKGGIMIYGEKNYVRNVPVEIFIGLIIENHWSRLVAGTKAVMETQPISAYVKLKPGDTPRGKTAKHIRGMFSKVGKPEDGRKVLALDVSEFSKMVPGASEIAEFVVLKETRSEEND
ncbi:MAG: fibronectin-binding domain-containing protein [Methanobacteriota archaeon]|nr:MAG: fibronectin-binding domain-containing protein [Euryarchaeota archaeon]